MEVVIVRLVKATFLRTTSIEKEGTIARQLKRRAATTT
jgi:hypothetical protein